MDDRQAYPHLSLNQTRQCSLFLDATYSKAPLLFQSDALGRSEILLVLVAVHPPLQRRLNHYHETGQSPTKKIPVGCANRFVVDPKLFMYAVFEIHQNIKFKNTCDLCNVMQKYDFLQYVTQP